MLRRRSYNYVRVPLPSPALPGSGSKGLAKTQSQPLDRSSPRKFLYNLKFVASKLKNEFRALYTETRKLEDVATPKGPWR